MASSHHHYGPSTTSSYPYLPIEQEESALDEKSSRPSSNLDLELGCPTQSQHVPSRCLDCRKRRNFRAWLPVIAYAATSLGFLVAIGWYKEELFTGLDTLSTWLKEPTNHGEAVLFALIFITCIPPFPLYSTLIILAGYTFGSTTGFVVSYFAALSGALGVFLVSRMPFCLPHIHSFLAASPSCAKAIRAIERNPRLLFAVRVAPYPYNVMNVLLAGAKGMSITTYTSVTALSLFKTAIHTSIGASLHSFASHDDNDDDTLGKTWTITGLVMCVGIFFYIAYVVRKRVDGEIDDSDATGSEEERMAFLGEMEEVR